MRALLALSCCLVFGAQAEGFSGKVIAVFDGDTLLVARDGKPAKVRLANIDAPEKQQSYGRLSRQSLQELVGKRVVQVDSQAVDQYGRLIGFVRLETLDINQEQVRRGMAWEYSYHHGDRVYSALQDEAKRARRGLWAEENPQPPWRWRKQHPSSGPGQTLVPRGAPVMMYDMACGKKRRCSEMASCEEARFYLVRCGVQTLDGDHDGQPCKSLCGE